MFPRFRSLPKALRNALLCSFYRITGKLKYPSEILPKTCFKAFIDLDSLMKEQRVYFLRRSDKPLNLTFNHLGDIFTLKDDVISYNEIPNLSVNLMGRFYKTKYVKFKLEINSNASKPWDGKSTIFLSDHVSSFSITNSFCPIFIDSINIHELIIPYNRPQEKDLDNQLKVLGLDYKAENKKYRLKGKIKFIPAPINLNYWHAELKIFDYKNELINYKSSNWIKEWCKQILTDVVAVNSSPTEPSFVIISDKHFKKN
jgi:hypothetical protein